MAVKCPKCGNLDGEKALCDWCGGKGKVSKTRAKEYRQAKKAAEAARKAKEAEERRRKLEELSNEQ